MRVVDLDAAEVARRLAQSKRDKHLNAQTEERALRIVHIARANGYFEHNPFSWKFAQTWGRAFRVACDRRWIQKAGSFRANRQLYEVTQAGLEALQTAKDNAS